MEEKGSPLFPPVRKVVTPRLPPQNFFSVDLAIGGRIDPGGGEELANQFGLTMSKNARNSRRKSDPRGNVSEIR